MKVYSSPKVMFHLFITELGGCMLKPISIYFTAGTKYRVNVNCGCTLIQKTHDFSLNDDLYYLPYSKRTHSLEQFNHNGILIIRNPFRAILSYRNFENGGLEGPTSEEQFVGPGLMQNDTFGLNQGTVFSDII